MSKASIKSKVSVSSQAFCGIDVSKATLVVAVQREGIAGFERREFANSSAGHKQLIGWLLQRGSGARVSLEATGLYSLDVALALEGAGGIEVAMLNPKIAKLFARSLGRSKTDATDAQALSEYSRRMEFVAWQRPSAALLALRTVGRHIASLVEDHTRGKNRLHAAEGSATAPRCVCQDQKRALKGLEKRILRQRREAVALIRQDAELKRKFEQLISIPGIAETSAVQLLSELAGLDPEMTARQWVAYSGLDPAHRVSGSSVNLPSRISRHGNRHLRKGLYMPALVGVRCDPYFRAFYLELKGRGKAPLQALMAVARKLLHAIFGIFKTGTPYDGAKLFPQLIPTS
jgi:transposase